MNNDGFKFLLDTNVISELTKKQPNDNVVELLSLTAPDSLYISVITIGEIKKGIEKISDNLKKEELNNWFDNYIFNFFKNRIINIDINIAKIWGNITASSNKTLPAIDCFIAATAIANDMVLVTRNIKDFEDIEGLSSFNPFIRRNQQ